MRLRSMKTGQIGKAEISALVLAFTLVVSLGSLGFLGGSGTKAFAEDTGETPEDDNMTVPPEFKIKPIMDHSPVIYGDMNNDGVEEMVIYREKRGEDHIRVTLFYFQNPPAEAVNGAVNVLLEDRRISFAEPRIGDADGDGNKDLILFVQARVPTEEGTGWRRIRYAVEAIDFHGNKLAGFPKFIGINPDTADLNFTTVEDPDSAVPES